MTNSFPLCTGSLCTGFKCSYWCIILCYTFATKSIPNPTINLLLSVKCLFLVIIVPFSQNPDQSSIYRSFVFEAVFQGKMLLHFRSTGHCHTCSTLPTMQQFLDVNKLSCKCQEFWIIAQFLDDY